MVNKDGCPPGQIKIGKECYGPDDRVQLEARWGIDDLDEHNMKTAFIALKKGLEVNIYPTKEIRSVLLKKDNGELSVDCSEYWDDLRELADTINGMGGKIDLDDETQMEMLGSDLPWTDDGQPGYTVEKIVPMPKNHNELRRILAQTDDETVHGSNKRFNEVISFYTKK